MHAALDGAQDFRWRQLSDGWSSGVLKGNLLHLRQVDDALEYRAKGNLNHLLISYFRLDEDMAVLRAELSARDAHVAKLVNRYPYLRVLRQPDPWECTAAYICSATNSVPGIGKMVEKIAKAIGLPVELDGEVRYAFPSPQRVVEPGVDALERLRLGMDRHAKIFAAAQRICASRLDLSRLSQPETCYAEARRRLMICRGIGNKIADCIALFALDKMEAFPVDRWVERAMQRYFPFGNHPVGDELAIWAQDYFGRYAGYANQLLFREQRDSSYRK